jgi:hypothetical protein
MNRQRLETGIGSQQGDLQPGPAPRILPGDRPPGPQDRFVQLGQI